MHKSSALDANVECNVHVARPTRCAGLVRPPSAPGPVMRLSSIPDAITDFARGKFVLLVGDADRENEGDLCVAAELVTPEHITFMARKASGLICTAMSGERLDQLGIEPAVARNTSPHTTAFTVSVEAKHLTTTGISAHDRAATVRHLVDPDAKPSDFVRPGHTFPLRAAEGGVLERDGHTEGSVDLARMAGLEPAAVICEVMNDDGTMARGPDLERFAAEHGLHVISIKDLAAHRRLTERLVRKRAHCMLPVKGIDWKTHVYEDLVTGDAHLALVHGKIDASEPVLVRAHSCCVTGDVFGSARCDCGEQLDEALDLIIAEGRGIVLYFGTHEGRGIGLINKLRAYSLQEQGLDTVEANRALHQPFDSRDYSAGATMLHDLGVRDVRLLTNNPAKVRGLECHGIRILERVPLALEANPHNLHYLERKRERMGHLL
jgi:3,4-dihydroxy 2-butanone 4-phosphate synthase / GTP cyclohydrolase II